MSVVNYFKNMFLSLAFGAGILIVFGLIGIAVLIFLAAAILSSALSGKELGVSLDSMTEKANEIAKKQAEKKAAKN